jgi:hypothetical protein
VLVTATVLAPSLALVLAASPTLWIHVSLEPPTCDAQGLRSAIVALAPAAKVAVGNEAPAGDLQVTLLQAGGEAVLTVTGRGDPLVRALPHAKDCNQTLETAALMVTRYLDAIPSETNEVTPVAAQEVVAPVPSPPSEPGAKTRAWLSLGPTLLGAPAGLTAGLALEVGVRLRFVQFSLGGEAGLAQHAPVNSSMTSQGEYVVTPAAAWITAAFVPQLGPGKLILGLSGGVFYTSAFVRTSVPVSQQGSSSAFDGFAGVRVGYLIDLPANFAVSLTYEERYFPAPTQFVFDGFPDTVSVPTLSGELALMMSWYFF